MVEITPLLRAIAEGRPEALGPLADWCAENGRAAEAAKLLRYQARLAAILADVARDIKEPWDEASAIPRVVYRGLGGGDVKEGIRRLADGLILRMQGYVGRMFGAGWRAMMKETNVNALADNLRRIYGGDSPGASRG